jgi:hypothetical protein
MQRPAAPLYCLYFDPAFAKPYSCSHLQGHLQGRLQGHLQGHLPQLPCSRF